MATIQQPTKKIPDNRTVCIKFMYDEKGKLMQKSHNKYDEAQKQLYLDAESSDK